MSRTSIRQERRTILKDIVRDILELLDEKEETLDRVSPNIFYIRNLAEKIRVWRQSAFSVRNFETIELAGEQEVR